MVRKIRLSHIILCSFLLLSCKNDNPFNAPSPQPANSISNALQLWRSWNLHDYTLGQQWNCTYYPWCGDSALIVVRNDTMVSITLVDTKELLESNLWGRYRTVDQLFALVHLDTNQYDISYEFNATFGYPERVGYRLKPPPRTEGSFGNYTYAFFTQ